MGEVAWVEILSRGGEVLSRHRFAGGEIHVGRGYANDVIVDDPYVASRHLRLRRENGEWLVEDLGSANGTFLDHGKTPVKTVAVHGNHVLRIGHTYLRVRESGHEVGPERAAQPLPQPYSHRKTWLQVLGLLVAMTALSLLLTWLNETVEPRLVAYLSPIASLLVFALVWAAIWSVLCRIFAGQAHFDKNLLITLAWLLAMALIEEAGDFIAYGAAWRFIDDYKYVELWVAVAVICILHLREIGRSHMKLKVGVVTVLAALGIGMQTLSTIETRNNSLGTLGSTELKPPVFRMAPLQSEAQFFAHVNQLEPKLARERAKDPEGGSDGDDD